MGLGPPGAARGRGVGVGGAGGAGAASMGRQVRRQHLPWPPPTPPGAAMVTCWCLVPLGLSQPRMARYVGGVWGDCLGRGSLSPAPSSCFLGARRGPL